MDIRMLYDSVKELQIQLQTELLDSAAQELQWEPAIRSAPDYRKVQALSACFTLQEFLSNAIAEAVAVGRLPAEAEGADWSI